MKTSLRLTIALLLAAAAVPLVAWHRGSAAQDSAPQKEQKEKFHRAAKPVRDRYIVVLKRETPGQEVEATTNELLAQHGGNVDHIYTHAIKGFSIQIPEAAAIALSRNPKVEYVEEDSEATLSKTEATSNWNLGRIDQRSQNDFQYYFPNVENGAGVNAYILDTGINVAHREWAKEDGTGNRATLDTDLVSWDGQNGNDCNGHGTAVAGLVGGRTFGVAKGVRLHGVRVFSCGDTTWTSTIIAGVDWVTQHHVKPAVANMSLGTGVDYGLEDAVRGSIAAGVTYVVAAGNNNGDVKDVSPARIPEVLTVAGTDFNDQRAFRSNFGSGVDLFAPGQDITSAGIVDLNGNGVFDDPAQDPLLGTSFAAPHVTGAVARFLQVNPNATPAAVHGAVVNSATPNVVGDAQGSPNLFLYADLRHAKLDQRTAFITESAGADTGIDVVPGQWVGFTASGEIWSGVLFTPNNGPQGWNTIDNNPNLPLPGSRPFSLIGRLTNPNFSQNFYIGNSNSTGPSSLASQRLSLRTNDDLPGNGSGAFICDVELWKKLPDAAADYINQIDVPTTMLAGQTVMVGVAMKNVGRTAWTAGEGYKLAAQGDSMIWGTNRVPVTSDVAPGGNVGFFFYITAPTTPGTYNFQWRMLQEGAQRFGDVSPNTTITVLAPSNQAQFISQSVKSVMTASEFSTVSITLKNIGTTTWTAGSAYRLGSQNPQDNMTWGLNRVVLPNNVPPGATVTFTFDVFAPAKSGTYNFQWRMVQDGVAWFGPLTPNVAVSVKPPPCARC